LTPDEELSYVQARRIYVGGFLHRGHSTRPIVDEYAYLSERELELWRLIAAEHSPKSRRCAPKPQKALGNPDTGATQRQPRGESTS
jgi:hypothetical protein